MENRPKVEVLLAKFESVIQHSSKPAFEYPCRGAVEDSIKPVLNDSFIINNVV